MKKLIRLLRNCLAFLLGYTIRVYWNNYTHEHFVFTFEGMLDCMSMYPEDALCIVSFMGTHVVITRGGRNYAI